MVVYEKQLNLKMD